MTTDIIECPICYETIDGVINTIITECGHKFHANCLMKNVAHNGFGCPCCRAKMAEEETAEQEAEQEDDHDHDEYESDDNESDDDSTSSDDSTDSGNEDTYNDYALLGLRLFTARMDGEEPEPLDILMNRAMDGFDHLTSRIDDNTYPVPSASLPTHEYVTEQLVESGVTIYQLVSTLMLDHIEYDGWQMADDNYNDITKKIRRIIDEFKTREREPREREPRESMTRFDHLVEQAAVSIGTNE
jgi:hypothetical protein